MNDSKTKNEEIARLAEVVAKEGWQVDAIQFEPAGGPFDKRPAQMYLTLKLSPLSSQSRQAH
jgi:hypothetical protein